MKKGKYGFTGKAKDIVEFINGEYESDELIAVIIDNFASLFLFLFTNNWFKTNKQQPAKADTIINNNACSNSGGI